MACSHYGSPRLLRQENLPRQVHRQEDNDLFELYLRETATVLPSTTAISQLRLWKHKPDTSDVGYLGGKLLAPQSSKLLGAEANVLLRTGILESGKIRKTRYRQLTSDCLSQTSCTSGSLESCRQTNHCIKAANHSRIDDQETGSYSITETGSYSITQIARTENLMGQGSKKWLCLHEEESNPDNRFG